jgi:hypothetical protein
MTEDKISVELIHARKGETVLHAMTQGMDDNFRIIGHCPDMLHKDCRRRIGTPDPPISGEQEGGPASGVQSLLSGFQRFPHQRN